MRNVQVFGSRWFRAAMVAGALISSAACDEDLTAVNQQWTIFGETWATSAAEARSLQADLAQKAGSLPAIAPGDAEGKKLQAALDDAMTAQAAAADEAERGLIPMKASIEAAQKKKKVIVVEEAIQAGRTTWTPLAEKLTAANTAATQAYGALKSHLDEEAKKAAERANNPVYNAGVEVAFAIAFKSDTEVDGDVSEAQLARLRTMLDTCESVQVHVLPPGKNPTTRSKRRQAVVDAMLTRGSTAPHFPEVDFATEPENNEGDVVVKVVVPCT